MSPPARGASIQAALPGGSGNGAGGSSTVNSSGGNLPISDNNVSTTAGDGVSDCTTGNAPVEWGDVGETDDINMAVAAAIGVGGGAGGSDDLGGNGEGRPSPPRPSSNRIIGQKQSASPAASRASHLGEINRSIEKMSLSGGSSSAGGGGGGSGICPSATVASTSSPKAVIAVPPCANRRDSNWTSVSTEGYGSMRSSEGGGCLGGAGTGGGGGGRRCSELSIMSQASNLSTRANVNSPWDPISAGSSRRSSAAEAGSVGAAAAPVSQCGHAGAISHHIDRLRRRAQQKGSAAPQAAPTTSPTASATGDGRQSAMSDCTVESQQQPCFATPRRASDPVRALDRNFGVGGQMGGHGHARNGSCNHLNKQRLPPPEVMAGGARVQVSAEFPSRLLLPVNEVSIIVGFSVWVSCEPVHDATRRELRHSSTPIPLQPAATWQSNDISLSTTRLLVATTWIPGRATTASTTAATTTWLWIPPPALPTI